MEAEITVAPEPGTAPPRGLRWVLAFTLLFALLPLQIIIGVPLFFVFFAVQFKDARALADMTTTLDLLIDSDWMIWLALAAAGIAGAVTVAAALLWPRLIGWFRSDLRFDLAEWIAWRRPRYLQLWMVPIVTLGALLIGGLGLSYLFGETEVQVQLMLFRTPALRVFSTLLVSTLVPLSEELAFRGGLYTALLRPRREDEPRLRRHITPFLVTMILFGAVHLLSGFETAGAIIQVFVLSAFITALRTATGSVWPSIVAHATWNLAAALALAVTGIGF